MADRNKGHISSLGYIKLIETYLERDCKETGQAKHCTERGPVGF